MPISNINSTSVSVIKSNFTLGFFKDAGHTCPGAEGK